MLLSAIPCPQDLFGTEENLVVAARRELKEETGLDACAIKVIHKGAYTSAGASSERIALVLAIVDMAHAGGVHGHPDENEDLKSIIMDAELFIKQAATGKLRDLSTILAALQLAQSRKTLRREFNAAARKKKNARTAFPRIKRKEPRK